jgi:hypothetical protein
VSPITEEKSMRKITLILIALGSLIGCDDIETNFKVVTNPEVIERVDLLTKNGPWLCKSSRDSEDLAYESVASYIKTGPDSVVSHGKVKMIFKDAVEMSFAGLASGQVTDAGTIEETIQFLDIGEIKVRRKPKSSMSQSEVDAKLSEWRSMAAMDLQSKIGTTTSDKIEELTADSFKISNADGSMTCHHGKPSELLSDWGLITR